MPAFTTIADTALAEGKPVRAIDTRALRDNPLAIAEGNDTAPAISPWAFFTTVTAGSSTRLKEHLEWVTSESNEQVAFWAQVFCSGTLTMSVKHKANDTEDTHEARVRFYRSRSSGFTQIGSWDRTANGTTSTRTANVSVLLGDRLIVTHGVLDANTSRVFDFELSTGGEYFFAIGTGGLVLPIRPTGS